MNNKKMIGIALIIIGVALTIWGFNIYDSAGSQFNRALSGDAPLEAWAGMIIGIVFVVIGVMRVK